MIAILTVELILGYCMTFYGVRIYDTMYIFAGAGGIVAVFFVICGVIENIYILLRKSHIEE
jgi:hypothetical protein